jgi:DNA invertase Pin-like site-specific DNA recombinase
MTTQRKNFIGYIRVSRVNGRTGPTFISPDVQRERIEQWAAAHGHTIVAWVEELDRSAKEGKQRPEFDSAVERVVSGACDGIVVWKFSRFGRSLIESALRIQQIEKVGGMVESATEGGQSKLTRNIMLAIAEDEVDRISESWAEAKQRANKRGTQIGRAPLGYVKVDGKLEIDPVYGPVMQEAFTLAGQLGIHAAVDHLSAHGPDREFDVPRVRALLARRTFLGEVKSGALVNTTAHDALVSLETWNAAQTDPAFRRGGASAHYPLSNIARCATCGAGMHGQLQTVDGVGRRRYVCGNRNGRNSTCTAGASIAAEPLEQLIRDTLAENLARPTWVAQFGTTELDAANAEVTAAQEELTAFALKVSATSPAFEVGVTQREQVLVAAEARFQQLAGHAARVQRLPLPAELATAEGFARGLRATLAGTPEAGIFVSRGRAALLDRIEVVWASRMQDSGTGQLAA